MTSRPNLKPTLRNSEFYRLRMNASLAEADGTELPNVRAQALRAAEAWREMLDKADLFEKRQGR